MSKKEYGDFMMYVGGVLVIFIISFVLSLMFSYFYNGLTGYSILDNDPALIGYWNFDDGTAKDLSGNGNDGIDDYLELNGLNQNFSDGFSVSVWANVKGGGAISNIIARTNGTRGARPFQLYYSKKDGGKIVFVIKKAGSTSAVNSGNNFNSNVLNKWVHYVGVFEPREYVKLYINGEEIASGSSIIPILDNPSDLKTVIGADSLHGNNFNGTIDEVMIFNKVLINDEVKEIYDSQLIKVSSEVDEAQIEEVVNVNNVTVNESAIEINMTSGDEGSEVGDDATINETGENREEIKEEQEEDEEIRDEMEVQSLECKFNRIYCSDVNGNEISGAGNGEKVFMNVESEGCDKRIVQFIIYEEDGVLGRAERSRFESVIENNFARQEVVVNWECDGDVFGICTLGNPDYIFVASTNPTGESGVLSVGREQAIAEVLSSPINIPGLDPNSPLAKGEHPRLHITTENLAGLRAKLGKSRSEGGYKEDYQGFVNDV